MAKKNSSTDAVLRELRSFGLAYPGAHTKSPWPGHLDLAVKDKTFAYLSIEGQPFSMSCKLPRSGLAALDLPFSKPTGYGLGKSGWVTVEELDGQLPPVEMLQSWIDESYRAQAPKKLVAALGADGGEPALTPTRRPPKKPATKPKASAKPSPKKKSKPTASPTTQRKR